VLLVSPGVVCMELFQQPLWILVSLVMNT
jgi:hypothetical protein